MTQFSCAKLLPILALPLAMLYLPAVAAQSDAAVRAQTLIDVNPLLRGYGIRVLGGDGPLRLKGSVADASDRS
jgi:hypothetical protein